MNPIKRIFLNDYFILALIIANALLIFVQEFDRSGSALDYIEPGFTLLFLVEMSIKMRAWGIKKYFSGGWNRFDFILVVLALPSLAVIFYNNDIPQLSVFLVLRVFRIFKFFRIIRFFPNISSLMTSVIRALKASYIVIAGFFILIFMISLVTCALYKDIAPEYFHNPANSFYSIFRLFSVEGWYEIPDLIGTRTSPAVEFLSKLYFASLLFCGGIIGLSLVNSIFVDAMVSDNNDELEKKVSELSAKIDKLSEKIDSLNQRPADNSE